MSAIKQQKKKKNKKIKGLKIEKIQNKKKNIIKRECKIKKENFHSCVRKKERKIK